MNDDEYDSTDDDGDNENHDHDVGRDDDYDDDIHDPHEGDLASTFPPTPELERITYYPNYPGDRHCHHIMASIVIIFIIIDIIIHIVVVQCSSTNI